MPRYLDADQVWERFRSFTFMGVDDFPPAGEGKAWRWNSSEGKWEVIDTSTGLPVSNKKEEGSSKTEECYPYAHEWAEYVGITQRFWYCKKCDKKRDSDK